MPRQRNRKKRARNSQQAPRLSPRTAPEARRAAPATPDDDAPAVRTIHLREEQIVARRQVVEAGLVQVRTEVESEPQHLDVTVAREEVYVERQPVARRAAARPLGAEGVLAEIPEYGEQVHLRTQPVVTREITIQKDVVEDVRQIADTKLREVLRVETSGRSGPLEDA